MMFKFLSHCSDESNVFKINDNLLLQANTKLKYVGDDCFGSKYSNIYYCVVLLIKNRLFDIALKHCHHV